MSITFEGLRIFSGGSEFLGGDFFDGADEGLELFSVMDDMKIIKIHGLKVEFFLTAYIFCCESIQTNLILGDLSLAVLNHALWLFFGDWRKTNMLGVIKFYLDIL